MTYKIAGTDAASWVLGGPATGRAHVSTQSTTAPGSGSSSGVSAAPSSTKNKEVEDVVRTMQDSMRDLGNQLSNFETAQKIATQFSVDAKEVQKMAGSFSRTAASAPRAATNDGIWGSNTKAALENIQKFVEYLKIPQVIIDSGKGPIPFKTMKDEEILESARGNLTNLHKTFSHLGLQSQVTGTAGSENFEVLDAINPSLPNSDKDPLEDRGSLPVTRGDVESFASFFNFMHRLTPPWNCTPSVEKEDTEQPYRPTTAGVENIIEKLAKEILDNTIVRLADEMVKGTAKQGVVLCVGVIDKILEWFSERSNLLYQSLYEKYKDASPDPRNTKKRISVNDVKLGQLYVDKVNSLITNWEAFRESVIEALRKSKQDPQTAPVTLKVLREAQNIGPSTSGRGRAHIKTDDTEEGSSGRTEKRHQYGSVKPLGQFINLRNFSRIPSVRQVSTLSDGGEFPALDMTEWTGGWTVLADRYVKGLEQTDENVPDPTQDRKQKFNNFGPWALSVAKSLKAMYADWIRKNPNDTDVREQNDYLTQWLDLISSVYGTWSRSYQSKLGK